MLVLGDRTVEADLVRAGVRRKAERSGGETPCTGVVVLVLRCLSYAALAEPAPARRCRELEGDGRCPIELERERRADRRLLLGVPGRGRAEAREEFALAPGLRCLTQRRQARL